MFENFLTHQHAIISKVVIDQTHAVSSLVDVAPHFKDLKTLTFVSWIANGGKFLDIWVYLYPIITANVEIKEFLSMNDGVTSTLWWGCPARAGE